MDEELKLETVQEWYARQTDEEKDELFRVYCEKNSIRVEFDNAKNIYEKRTAIRKAYLLYDKYIKDAFIIGKTVWTDPYIVNFPEMFTSIEDAAWNLVRGIGGLVFYPQYPALNYWIDFANPCMKIALEVDGKQHDKTYDIVRDKELRKLGWTVFRVPGVECLREYKSLYDIDCMLLGKNDPEREDLLRDFWMNTLEGVITAIRVIYFDGIIGDMDSRGYPYQTLQKHTIINFNI